MSKMCLHKKFYTDILHSTSVLFIIAKIANHPTVHQVMTEKPNSGISYSMRCYSAIKESEILIHTSIWINLKNFMQVKESWYKRPYVLWFYLYEMPKIDKSIETESGLAISKGWGVMECDC